MRLKVTISRDFVAKEKFLEIRDENDKLNMRNTLLQQIFLTPDNWDMYHAQLKKLEN